MLWTNDVPCLVVVVVVVVVVYSVSSQRTATEYPFVVVYAFAVC